MKVGDLVNLVNYTASNVTIRKNGIIIKIDMGRKMEPYNIPACLVVWPANIIRWEFIDVLEVISIDA
jgi:hypothetical protein